MWADGDPLCDEDIQTMKNHHVCRVLPFHKAPVDPPTMDETLAFAERIFDDIERELDDV